MVRSLADRTLQFRSPTAAPGPRAPTVATRRSRSTTSPRSCRPSRPPETGGGGARRSERKPSLVADSELERILIKSNCLTLSSSNLTLVKKIRNVPLVSGIWQHFSAKFRQILVLVIEHQSSFSKNRHEICRMLAILLEQW